MSTEERKSRGFFGTNFGFILAAAGSAVGLGNIWKFPYITGEYGGGAFVLVYLVCIALVGMPLMYAEMIIGRRGGKNVLGAMRDLTQAKGVLGRLISYVTGFMAVASGFLILSFYSVVAGWAIHFFMVSVGGLQLGEGAAAGTFKVLAGNAKLSSAWHTLFMLLTVVIVAQGIRGGIERLCKILMPLLAGILLLLLGYVAVTGGLGASARFLFAPNFEKLTVEAVLEALGHSFFTLSLGMGAMVTYGSYLREERYVVRDGFWVAVLDTALALLAGLVIFAVVFRFGLEPSAGPGLLFMTLPDLFAKMPGGVMIASAFFLLVILAAWSSAVSLLEVVVAYAVDELGWGRKTSAIALGVVIWGVGLASAIDGRVLDFLDNITTKYMLPFGGLFIALAAGWLVSRKDRESGFLAIPSGGVLMATAWTFLIRFVTPALVVVVILAKMGLF